jgi:hypothetical protein
MTATAPASRPATRRGGTAKVDRVTEDARAAFDRLYGREISDGEFEEIRTNLLDFFAILRRWSLRGVRSISADLQSTDGYTTSHE